MLNFFDMIFDFFQSLWQMVINIISSTLNAIQIVGQAVAVPFALIPFVNGLIGASIALVVGLGVIKLILGWGNS